MHMLYACTETLTPRAFAIRVYATPFTYHINKHIIFYRSGPERVRHAFGVHVLPEMHYATQLRVQTVDRVAPERKNVSLAQNARHVRVLPPL